MAGAVSLAAIFEWVNRSVDVSHVAVKTVELSSRSSKNVTTEYMLEYLMSIHRRMDARMFAGAVVCHGPIARENTLPLQSRGKECLGMASSRGSGVSAGSVAPVRA